MDTSSSGAEPEPLTLNICSTQQPIPRLGQMAAALIQDKSGKEWPAAVSFIPALMLFQLAEQLGFTLCVEPDLLFSSL
uniref:Uncharacterized protein n=1 Tax=Knipowitschia caucasica TaxID=637954 RepID=A0AAV2M6H8_KNICA